MPDSPFDLKGEAPNVENGLILKPNCQYEVMHFFG